MNDQWEAFTERAAIMEFDGGLDRQAAVLAAFGLCFPGDFRECLNTAEQGEAGETMLYDYLEHLIRGGVETLRNSPIEAPGRAVGAQAIQTHHTAPKSPPKAHYKGLDAIKIYLDRKIKLIGRYESGAAIATGEDYQKAFASDMDTIKALMSGDGDTQGRAKGTQIQRFDFRPADYGFLCLDIDVKDGKDGLRDFYTLLESWGKPRDKLPAALREIPESFPCYVATPSGGVHLYFKYRGPDTGKLLSKTYESIEVKYGARTITIPGSRKPGGEYVLHGSLEKTPELYGFIADNLPRPEKEPKRYIPMKKEPRQWDTTWDKICEFTDRDNKAGAGRNNRAYSLALHAKTHGWNETDTLDALQNEPSISGLPATEIITAVRSAYRGKSA
jgi:hypothetical protein